MNRFKAAVAQRVAMLNHLEALTALPAPAPALGPGRGAELHSCGQTGHQECPHQPPRQPLHRQRGALGFRHLVAPGSGEAGGGAGDDAAGERGEGDWTYADAYKVGFTCCGAGIVVYSAALCWQLHHL